MPKLTIITGDATGKTTFAKGIAQEAARHQRSYVDFDEAQLHLTSPGGRMTLADALESFDDVVVVVKVPRGAEVEHINIKTQEEPEREYRLTGFPGCNDYHPQNETEAIDMVRQAVARMRLAEREYRLEDDYSMAEEMRRRQRNANYESRVITEWEEGK